MDGVAPGRAPHQLPSGRHGLPRAFVISNQRERILDGVMRVVAAHGYAGLRIEDVISIAGVSRRTFYDHFQNKEEAFLAAYDLVVNQLSGAVSAAFASADSWPVSVRRGLSSFLNQLAAEPTLAHICIVDVLAAGPEALARRNAAMARFREYFFPPAAIVENGPPVSPLAPETVVGGIYEVIYSRIVAGEVARLPELLPDLLHTVLLPFAGPEVAAAERARLLTARAAAPPDPGI